MQTKVKTDVQLLQLTFMDIALLNTTCILGLTVLCDVLQMTQINSEILFQQPKQHLQI